MAEARRITWKVILILTLALGGGTAMADDAATPVIGSTPPPATPAAQDTAPAQPKVTPQQVGQALLQMTSDGDYDAFIKHWAPSCQPDAKMVWTGDACRNSPQKCGSHIPNEQKSFLMRGFVIKKNNITKVVVRNIHDFDSCKLPANITALGVNPRTANGVFKIEPTNYVWVELTDKEFGSTQFLPLGIVRIGQNDWQIVGGSCVVKRPYLSLLKKYCDPR